MKGSACVVAAIIASFGGVELRGQVAPPIDGPPAPVAPEVITRAPSGQATVRAIKLTSPFKVDGQLDEDVYAREKPFGGLIQVTPRYGEPQTERSEVWITYDDHNMYVTCRCWDSAPPDEWIVNELRRDTNGLRQNDHFGVMFDTFYDRRNGFMFYTNPLGARADYSVVDEGSSNTDWNPVWTSKTGRFDGGWTVEMAIPFKSIRYRAGKNQVWGIQLRRSIRRKNEWGYLTPVPQSLAGPQALNRVSAGGTLVGLDLPEAGKNIELKPYGVARMTTDRLRTPPVSNDLGGDVGGDAKYGITPNLTADFTVNTDFAQVEIDEQQVNLTRFSLFFPEKRDFFLEGRGIFDFARGGTGIIPSAGASDLPYLFYSRRIGLNAGRVIPITAGGRLTGKIGQYAVGLMNIQTEKEPVSGTDATNFTVFRVKRDVFRRSAIGVMATNRSVSTLGTGSNQAYGVDGAFSFFENVTTGVYWARTATTGLVGDDQSYQGRFEYNADRYGARAVPRGGQELQPGGRFHSTARLQAIIRRAALQPATEEHQERPQVHVERERRIHRQRRRVGGRAHLDRALHYRAREQRPVQHRLHQRLRAACSAVRARWIHRHHPAGRLHVQRCGGRVCVRRAATRLGHDHGPGRTVLRRNDQERDDWPGPDVAGTHLDPHAALPGADVLPNADHASHRVVHHEAGEGTRGLRLLPAHVREWPLPVQLRGPRYQHESSVSVGIPSRQRAVSRLY